MSFPVQSRHQIPHNTLALPLVSVWSLGGMKEKDKRHKRSSSKVLNVINRTPAPIAVLVGIFFGLVIARFWFGPVSINIFTFTSHASTTVYKHER